MARRREQLASEIAQQRRGGHEPVTRAYEPRTLPPLCDDVDLPPNLLDAISEFSPVREVEHCNAVFALSPFETEWDCPTCRARVLLRSSSRLQIEDVFDAVFYWMEVAPRADEWVRQRTQEVLDVEGDDGGPESI